MSELKNNNEHQNEFNISEEDLYFLSHIQALRSQSSLFKKEGFNKYMNAILKKYNTNSLDFLRICNYLDERNFHLKPELIEKYGEFNIESAKKSSSFKGGFLYFAILIAITLGIVVYINGKNNDDCGCSIPDVTIPNYADSWDDKEENWIYKTCDIASSSSDAEKIHIYVFFNKKINKYRCELKYSYPGTDCSSVSKSFGMNSISTAELSKEDFYSQKWKTYEYWLNRYL